MAWLPFQKWGPMRPGHSSSALRQNQMIFKWQPCHFPVMDFCFVGLIYLFFVASSHGRSLFYQASFIVTNMLYVGYIGGRCYCIFQTIIVHVLFIFNPVCTSVHLILKIIMKKGDVGYCRKLSELSLKIITINE